jgi:hypothetical protein
MTGTVIGSEANTAYTARAASTTLAALAESQSKLEAEHKRHSSAESKASEYLAFLGAQHARLHRGQQGAAKEMADFRATALDEAIDAPEGASDIAGLALAISKKSAVVDFCARAIQHLLERRIPSQRLELAARRIDARRAAAELAECVAVTAFRELYEQLQPILATGGEVLIQTEKTENLVGSHLEAQRLHLLARDEYQAELDRQAKAEQARVSVGLVRPH